MKHPGQQVGFCGCLPEDSTIEDGGTGTGAAADQHSPYCPGLQRCEANGECQCDEDWQCPARQRCVEQRCRCHEDADCLALNALPAADDTACRCVEHRCIQPALGKLCPLPPPSLNACGGKPEELAATIGSPCPLPAACRGEATDWSWQCHPFRRGELVCVGPLGLDEHGAPRCNGCGGGLPLAHREQDACGDCPGWTWQCQEDGTIACQASPAGRLNVCGGCLVPEHRIDERFGQPCDAADPERPCELEEIRADPLRRCCGRWQCDGPARLVCRDPGRNGCGGCQVFHGEELDHCVARATAGSFPEFFVHREDLFDQPLAPELIRPGDECARPRTEAAPQGPFCGAVRCEELPAEACGPDAPRWRLICSWPEAEADAIPNRCGGCSPFVDEAAGRLPGDSCADGGRWTCNAEHNLSCEPVRYPNSCGGARHLPGVAGMECAPCRRYVCDPGDPDQLLCERVAEVEPEVCDGVDNDCDGLIDQLAGPAGPEPLPGQLAQRQQGVCAGAVQVCFGVGGWQEPRYSQHRVHCDPARICGDRPCPCYEEREVTCDGRDNDCDGLIDEDAPPAEPSRGVCAGRVQHCDPPRGWFSPDPATLDGYQQVETFCDGLDNDCDGLTDDEDPDLPPNPLSGVCSGWQQVCGGAEGWEWPDFDEEAPLDYEPLETRCDGLDNDCDGQTDELDAPAEVCRQAGVCAGTQPTCGGPAGWLCPYPADQYEPHETRCDGLDNDCDGEADQGLPPHPADQQAGVCAGAQAFCRAATGSWEPDYLGWAAQRGMVWEAVETRCDGLDNDCDGQTDEELVPPPATRQAGVCQGTFQVCQGFIGWRDPDFAQLLGPVYQLLELRCDGLDNDCDGKTDLADRDLIDIQPAAARQLGVCAGQRKDCPTGDGWQEPDYTRIPAYEPDETGCDGLDNDCDGTTDEEAVCRTLDDCGRLGNRCQLPHVAQAECLATLRPGCAGPECCGIVACEDGFLDEDQEDVNGCEGNARAVVFVDPVRGWDQADGTLAHPVATLQRALEVAASPGRPQIRLSVGTEHVFTAPLSLKAGVSLQGGYCPGCEPAWARQAEPSVLRYVPASGAPGYAVIADRLGDGPPILLDRLLIWGAAAQERGAAGRDAASVVLYLRASNNVTLQDCELVSGPGLHGVKGENGAAPAVAVAGGDGGASVQSDELVGCLVNPAPQQGRGGVGACQVGGAGGASGLGDSGSGAAGGNAGGNGGPGGAPGRGGGNGFPGADGARGAHGAAVGGPGRCGADYLLPADGQDGADGTCGSGGGGGGGGGGGLRAASPRCKMYGGAGGGGGAGGLGGRAGHGGTGGGASIGVLAWESRLTLAGAVRVQTGNGGMGGGCGAGASGQLGGAGGAGGSNGIEASVGRGGSGGKGGNGGSGGYGSAGGGGPSLGFVHTLAVLFDRPEPAPVIQLGQGGNAGECGGYPGLNGGAGVRAEYLRLDLVAGGCP